MKAKKKYDTSSSTYNLLTLLSTEKSLSMPTLEDHLSSSESLKETESDLEKEVVYFICVCTVYFISVIIMTLYCCIYCIFTVTVYTRYHTVIYDCKRGHDH